MPLYYRYYFMAGSREVVFYDPSEAGARRQFKELFGYDAEDLLRRENW